MKPFAALLVCGLAAFSPSLADAASKHAHEPIRSDWRMVIGILMRAQAAERVCPGVTYNRNAGAKYVADVMEARGFDSPEKIDAAKKQMIADTGRLGPGIVAEISDQIDEIGIDAWCQSEIEWLGPNPPMGLKLDLLRQN